MGMYVLHPYLDHLGNEWCMCMCVRVPVFVCVYVGHVGVGVARVGGWVCLPTYVIVCVCVCVPRIYPSSGSYHLRVY